MPPRRQLIWMVLLSLPALARADVSMPFPQFDQRWRSGDVVREPLWRDVLAARENYAGRLLGLTVKVNGRIDSQTGTHLLAVTSAGEGIEVQCAGGCRIGDPGQWLGVIGRLPDDGTGNWLVGAAAARVAAPRPRTASTNTAIVGGGAAPTAGTTAPTGTPPPSGMAPLNPGGYAEAPPGSNVAPLAPEQLKPQPQQPAPEQPRYDTTALARLERFITERNPRIRADERRFIAIELIRYATWQQMRWEFFAAVIAAESDYDRFCVSHKGAMGLGQLMPANCAEFGVADPYDISQNLRASAQHIGEFLAKYSALDPTEQFKLALACYNAGPGAVHKYGGVPPYRETTNYIIKIARLYVRLCQESATANR